MVAQVKIQFPIQGVIVNDCSGWQAVNRSSQPFDSAMLAPVTADLQLTEERVDREGQDTDNRQYW